jgi:DNA-binding Xre family transcriptional regulator
MAITGHAENSDMEGYFVLEGARGKPEWVGLPTSVWEALPLRVRASHADRVKVNPTASLAFLRWDDFNSIREAVEDGFDEVVAQEGEKALARERALVRRARAKGIKAEVGIPGSVLAEERAGAHPIVAWRHHRGLTQTELAAASGIERSYLAHLESRRKTGAPETLAAIAGALGCFIDDLVRTTDAASKRAASKPGSSGRRRRREAA